MAKTTYWLTDGNGRKALVVGAEERDRWRLLGWSEADAPVEGDWVWMQHEVHGGKAKFTATGVPQWQAMGWQPSAPPEPENPYNSEPAAPVAARPVDVRLDADVSQYADAARKAADATKTTKEK